ncbi:MAG: murein L,D-transpeptidase catalytic domain family protein [Oceanococcus sp.]
MFSSAPLASPQLDSLLSDLAAAAPTLNQNVLEKAISAFECAAAERADDARLAVIDYSLPSSEPRMWVFDLAKRELLFNELVAHGRASGNKFSNKFSNTPGSHQTSIGLFKTLNTYSGRNGYSLRMQGLEPRFNNRAFDRAIVIHGASYVSEEFIEKTGRIGRSHGCPAVAAETAKPLIDTIKEGHYVFSWYPDPEYVAQSRLLQCPQQVAMR